MSLSSSPQPIQRERRTSPLLVALLLVAVVAGATVFVAERRKSDAERGRPEELEALTGTVLACSSPNGAGRPGTIFVPRTERRPLGVLVAFHGSGASGASMLPLLAPFAERDGFVVVAPDSGFVPEFGGHTWRVGGSPGETSPDSAHVRTCIEDALRAVPGDIQQSGWLALGHSGGGSSAPFLATHDPRFVAYAVLHGGVFERGLGAHRPRGWFSTGENDSLRPPEVVRSHAQKASVALSTPVDVHVYPGGHAVSPEEVDAVLAFWRRP